MISVAQNEDDGAHAEGEHSYFGLKAKRSHKAKGGGSRRGGQGRRRPRSNRKRRRRSLAARLSNPSYRMKPSALNCIADSQND